MAIQSQRLQGERSLLCFWQGVGKYQWLQTVTSEKNPSCGYKNKRRVPVGKLMQKEREETQRRDEVKGEARKNKGLLKLLFTLWYVSKRKDGSEK